MVVPAVKTARWVAKQIMEEIMENPLQEATSSARIFDEVLLKGVRSGQMPAKTDQARDWYRDAAKGFSRGQADPQKIIRGMPRDRYNENFRIGQMYMFGYDAKHKATLPYWDRYPLIFPINRAKGGFLGLNMHYLPPPLRAQLMDALYSVSSNRKYDESTRLRINYEILNGSAKFRAFKPCVKHYLKSQVKTKLVYIHPTEWDIALFLPTARWQGANAKTVYADSRKIIRG